MRQGRIQSKGSPRTPSRVPPKYKPNCVQWGYQLKKTVLFPPVGENGNLNKDLTFPHSIRDFFPCHLLGLLTQPRPNVTMYFLPCSHAVPSDKHAALAESSNGYGWCTLQTSSLAFRCAGSIRLKGVIRSCSQYP